MNQESKSLIVTIVKKGEGDNVIETSLKAGASGGTIMFGRGMGIREKKKMFGIPIEPEKEIVLTVVSSEKAKAVLDDIIEAAKLAEPGHGVAFSIALDQFAGAAHKLSQEIIEDSPEL